MEHFRSTLATTAIAVFGLVAAAHILHPGNYEPRTRPVRAPMADVAAVAGWVDPPAALRGQGDGPAAVADAGKPGVPASEAPVSASMAVAAGGPAAVGLLTPRMTAAPAPGETMAAALPSALVAQPGRPRAATQRKAAQRAVRSRQAALQVPGQAGARVADAPAAQPAQVAPARSGIDPIGDLIRGLGLDG